MLCMTYTYNLPHSSACMSRLRSRHHARPVMLKTPGSRKGSCAGEKVTLLLRLLEAVQAIHGGASHPVAYQHSQVDSLPTSAFLCLALPCRYYYGVRVKGLGLGACFHTVAKEVTRAAKPGGPVNSRWLIRKAPLRASRTQKATHVSMPKRVLHQSAKRHSPLKR